MKIIDKCNQILNELYKFSSELLYLGDHILDFRLENFEQKIGLKLPQDFK